MFHKQFLFAVSLACLLTMHISDIEAACSFYYSNSGLKTCDTIASEFKTSVELLKALNPSMTCPQPGSILICVPYSTSIVPPSTTTCLYSYTSKLGDTCESIGKLYGTTKEIMIALNSNINCNLAQLAIGTVVCVPSATQVAPSTSCTYSYFVKSNSETCASIASIYGVSLTFMAILNPSIDCSRSLTIGQRICAPLATLPSTTNSPTATSAAASATTTISQTTKASSSACTYSYIVKSGDTCTSIAAAYSISYTFFLALNPNIAVNPTLKCSNLLPGQIICAPQANLPTAVTTTTATAVVTAATCPAVYTVVEGSRCADLAAFYGITLNQFLALNPGVNCNNLQIGQKLCVPNIILSCYTTYTVQSGNTCYYIANVYSVSLRKLLEKNPGLDCNNLQIGRVLCIY